MGRRFRLMRRVVDLWPEDPRMRGEAVMPLTAQDLIEELQRLIDEHGDMLVTTGSTGECIAEVTACDSDGYPNGAPES